ncbi:MAG: hypothetical protein SO135_01125, partial [Sphaerochaetaceae bacterium]|nr:hypothetical protein [Sphaerochaetaceae bacterium]
MKKLLFGILVVCLALCMVGCDASIIGKLAETMGKLGNNIYGIEANLESVTETTASVDAAVETKTDGSVEVKLDAAAAITGDIAEIASSPQKTEALQTEMSKPVSENPDTSAKVKTQLEDKKAEVVTAATDAIDTSSAPAEVKAALKTVVSNISNIPVSDNPTRAELVTVAVVADLANTLKDNASAIASDSAAQLAVVNKALSALETIKTVNKTEVDLLKGVDIASAMASFTGGGKALAKGSIPVAPEVAQYISMMNKGIQTVINAIGTDAEGKLSTEGYTRFIAQMKSMRVAYETAAFACRPYSVKLVFTTVSNSEYGLAGVDAFLKGTTKAGGKYTVNDLVTYIVAVAFTEADSAAGSMTLNGNKYKVIDLLNDVLADNSGFFKGTTADFNTTTALEQFYADFAATFL